MPVFVHQRAVITTYTDILHHNIAIAISSYCHLFLPQTYQENRKPFILLIKVHLNFLEDGVWRVWCFWQIQQQIFAFLVDKIRFIVVFAYFTLGLWIRKEKRVVVLSFNGIITYPVFQALIVDVLNTPQTFAKAY